MTKRFWMVVAVINILFSACAPAHDRAAFSDDNQGVNDLGMPNPPSIPDLANGRQQPPRVEELGSKLETAGANWLFGDGIGKTMLNVGAVVAFPPYAIYLVGNAGLAMFGQEPLYVTDLLPEAPREGYLTVYDAVTSVPGMVTSTIAGEEFRTPKRLQ